MPLPRAEREIELLTEGWPGDPDCFELAAFAAKFRADRPELSAPAVDRIGRQMQSELARRDRAAARRQNVVATALRFRRFAPLAAAAVFLLAVGAWVHFRGAPFANGSDSPRPGLPVIHSQPAPPPEGAPSPNPDKPIIN